MVDESMDIATNKKLIMFCKIVHAGQIKIEFCANVTVSDGKADTIYNAIVNWMDDVGISFKNISGFGSDGAAVMTGRLSGVGVKLRAQNPHIIHVWCAAHRLSLVAHWAAKKVPYLRKVQELLIAIYYYYEFSAPRYNKLRELKKIMKEKVKKFKKPTEVRWLSLQDAIIAVYESWSVLILGMEHEAANAPRTEGGAKAKGIGRDIKTFKFISVLCLLKDILNILCKLSRTFQRDIIDIQQVTSMVISARDTIQSFYHTDPPTVVDLLDTIEESDEYKGIPLTCSIRDRIVFRDVKRAFVRNLVSEFNERFPEDNMRDLKDLNDVLNPNILPVNHAGIVNHGTESLERVIEKYGGGEGDNLIDPNRTRDEYLQFKFLLNVNKTF
ncbi:E3 SUMO-protein ligase KIAA1586-like [Ylistrum balloti]|uniref:E3 SUMO-protein ligase KIAA1586-like n=1 Tax=Ylistrum balloti TaxID=509963 RepID=UPI002905BAFF|nr:E3 SUMO-protein ligase KIAA1586-like [Ylistrum balloti]